MREHWHNFKLFLGLVWREWEPSSCGIPEPYRIKHRFTVREAWGIAFGRRR